LAGPEYTQILVFIDVLTSRQIGVRHVLLTFDEQFGPFDGCRYGNGTECKQFAFIYANSLFANEALPSMVVQPPPPPPPVDGIDDSDDDDDDDGNLGQNS
jgi:hypothetical protein